MDIGTNTEILGKSSKFNDAPKSKAGRPAVNKELVIRNLKLKDQLGNRRYTNSQIARMVGCSAKTIGRILKQALDDGEVTESEFEAKPIGVVEADFDSECERAKGMSFNGWLQTRFSASSQANTYFNFCSKVWNQMFGACALTDLADHDNPLADQMAIKFVTEFQEDAPRMRGRLKKIRFLFKFLSRGDINDKHLTMTDFKHPRRIRRVDEITEIDFGLKYTECENALVDILGEDARFMLRFKICTQMRTGDWAKEREFYGIQKGTAGKTTLTMTSPTDYRFRVYAKKGEEWEIIWMPISVAEILFTKYEAMEYGEQLMKIQSRTFIKAWRKVTKRIIGRELILHDLRKISLTWLYTMGVPVEVAVNINVGWKDTNTALSNYLDVKKVLRKQKRTDYRENIPDWFKQGLDDFTGFEAVIGG